MKTPSAKEKYDLVFGMGSACGCATILHQVGLQLLSLPFDWIGLVDLRTRVDLVAKSFHGWMQEKDMEKLPCDPLYGHDRYIDTATKLQYWHDFPSGCVLSEQLPKIKAKYDRRIARLDSLISKSKRILIVWMCDYRDAEPMCEREIRHCLETFSRRWPGRRFEMLCFEYKAGVAPDKARIERGDNYEIVSFDLRAKGEGSEPWMLDKSALGFFLSRYEVRDYRSRAERRAFAKKERRRELRRFGTDSRLVCCFRKLEWKLMKHLKKNLERHGVHLEGD